MVSRKDEEVLMTIDGDEQGATQGMPIVGQTVTIGGQLYRCVMVAYADAKETNGQPEIRVRFRQEAKLK